MKPHSLRTGLSAVTLALMSAVNAGAKDKDKDKDDDKHHHSKKVEHAKHDKDDHDGKPHGPPKMSAAPKPNPPARKSSIPVPVEKKLTVRPDPRRDHDRDDGRRPPVILETHPRLSIPIPVEPRVLVRGSSTIADVQRELARRGYYHDVIDGLSGPATRRAVAACQQEYRLPVTGEITPSLLRALQL